MKPLLMVSIALFGFATMAFAQNPKDDDSSTPDNRQAPITAPVTPMAAPCGAGPTTGSANVRGAAGETQPDRHDGAAIADLQCAGAAPIRTDAPPSTTAANEK